MTDLMGYLSRSTGIVATILAVAALAWGFFFSARETGTRLRPNWWLDLHNWLGGLALIFTGVHILAAWLDSNSGVRFIDVFVPGTATAGWAIGWGVIAAYLFSVAVFTSWPKRWKNRRWWRVVHLGSAAGMVLALIHTYQSGSDTGALWFQIGFVFLASVATYGLGIRVFTKIAKAREAV